MADEADTQHIEDDEVLVKKGAELFRELQRLYPVCEVEDYHKNGAWKDEDMRTDILLLRVHRREAGAPEPVELEDIPKPEIPRSGPMGQQSGFAGITVGGGAPKVTIMSGKGGATIVTRPVSAAVRPVGVQQGGLRPLVSSLGQRPAVGGATNAVLGNPAAELKLIALFIAKWKLDPTRTKSQLARLAPAHRKYVIQKFSTTIPGTGATAALEQFISQNQRSGWSAAGGAARPVMARSPGVAAVNYPGKGGLRIGAGVRPVGVRPGVRPQTFAGIGMKRPISAISSSYGPGAVRVAAPVRAAARPAIGTQAYQRPGILAVGRPAIRPVGTRSAAVRPVMAAHRVPQQPSWRPPAQMQSWGSGGKGKAAARPVGVRPPVAAGVRPARPAGAVRPINPARPAGVVRTVVGKGKGKW